MNDYGLIDFIGIGIFTLNTDNNKSFYVSIIFVPNIIINFYWISNLIIFYLVFNSYTRRQFPEINVGGRISMDGKFNYHEIQFGAKHLFKRIYLARLH